MPTSLAADPVLLFSLFILTVIVLLVVVLLFTASSEAEHRRLNFAATLLSGIGLIFLMAMAMYYFDGYTPATQQREANNDVGKSIFNSCIQVLPPIVTLVLGYYFGRSEGRRDE
jgi:amino acid transporter